MTKKMKNPLNRRLPRELKSEFGKYLVIFLFFIMVISLVSGFLVADTSLHTAYLDAFDKYNIEDGNFAYAEEASDDAIAAIEKDGKVKVYANFYKEEDTDDFESTFRAFGERNDIDKVCLLDGDMPKADTDVAIDRLYAKNHDLEIGDKFGVAGKDLTISGIVALSDYSTLYQNASDMMFDNDKFGVGVMTDAGFAALRENHLHYNYSWSYDTAPEDDAEAKDMAEDLMPILAENGMLTNFLPEYLNQAIIFAGDDMGGDMSMILAFLYIVIVILAFVFSITISNNITKEANVIGTLRASGYSRGEMVRHYLIMPMLVLLVAAVVGNVLGYTWLEQIFANQYLASYGLTTYEVLLNPQAFVLTTVIPLILLFIIKFCDADCQDANLAAAIHSPRPVQAEEEKGIPPEYQNSDHASFSDACDFPELSEPCHDLFRRILRQLHSHVRNDSTADAGTLSGYHYRQCAFCISVYSENTGRNRNRRGRKILLRQSGHPAGETQQ